MPGRGIGELLKLVVDRGPSIVLVTDSDARIMYVNRRFTEVTGYEADEVIGATPRVLQSGKTSRHVYASLWETIKAGRPWNGEILNRRKDGSLFWEEEHIAPICDAEGKVLYYTLCGEDISARKRVEAEAGRLLSENRRLVRKMMLVEQSEREHLARELHDHMGQYLAAIKTEAVRMRAHMDGRQTELVTCAEHIIADTEALFDLIHRLTLRLEPDMITRMGLMAALQQLIGRWQMRTGIRCDLELACQVDEIPHTVATVVYSIVRESLTNVLKHADARHVRVSIRGFSVRRRPKVSVSVCDNGHGLPEGFPKRLGLGIIGMRELATSMGGRMWIEGDGKRFCVFAELPIHAKKGMA